MQRSKAFTGIAGGLLLLLFSIPASGQDTEPVKHDTSGKASQRKEPMVRVLKNLEPPEDVREQAYRIQAQFEQELEEIKRKVQRLQKRRDQALRELFLDFPVIRRKLKQRVTIEFDDVPLREALKQLTVVTGINFAVDALELRDLGVSVNEIRTTASFHSIPLKSTLRFMLEQHELDFSIMDDAVIIFIAAHAEELAILRLHPVHDLVTPLPGELELGSLRDAVFHHADTKTKGVGFFSVGESSSEEKQGGEASDGREPSPNAEVTENDADASSDAHNSEKESALSKRFGELIGLIEDNIEVDSWDPVGFGTMEVYEPGKCLLIHQDRYVHEQIEEFLDRLRLAREMQTRIEIRRVSVKP